MLRLMKIALGLRPIVYRRVAIDCTHDRPGTQAGREGRFVGLLKDTGDKAGASCLAVITFRLWYCASVWPRATTITRAARKLGGHTLSISEDDAVLGCVSVSVSLQPTNH